MSTQRRFWQVDVFTREPMRGNPLAVVYDAAGLTDDQMRSFARWTNLSETVYLFPATDADADYRVRIMTPNRELPFAGHPTLGSCFVWLAAGNKPKTPGFVVQQCGVGLVRIKLDGDRFAFAAPPLIRSGPVEGSVHNQVCAALGVRGEMIQAIEFVDNGPGWVAALMPSAQMVLDLKPDFARMRGLDIGVVGPYPPKSECQFEVRAFCGNDAGSPEDPVTGSLNAGIAQVRTPAPLYARSLCAIALAVDLAHTPQWLIGRGRAPASYVASQGTALGRSGRIHITREAGDMWVGGSVVSVVQGHVSL